MMKKVVFGALFLAIASAFSFAQGYKVGYVDLEIILQNHPDFKSISSTMETKQKQYENQIQALRQQYQTKVQEYQQLQQNPMVTQTAMQDKAREIQNLEQRIQAMAMDAEQEMLQEQAKLLQPLEKKIGDAINAVAKEKNYDYVLNQRTTSGTSIVIYAKRKKEDNLTLDVLRKLGVTISAQLQADFDNQ